MRLYLQHHKNDDSSTSINRRRNRNLQIISSSSPNKIKMEIKAKISKLSLNLIDKEFLPGNKVHIFSLAVTEIINTCRNRREYK